MSASNVARLVLAVGLFAEAVATFYILRSFFAGLDATSEGFSAFAIGALIVALAIAIVVRPHPYELHAARGIALLGMIFCVGVAAFAILLGKYDLSNRGIESGLLAVIAGLFLLQVVVWIAAWKAEPTPFGDAVGYTVPGAVAVVIAATIVGFIIRFIVSFFP